MNFFKSKYKDWTIEFDAEATNELYAKMPTGIAETCGCDSCLNYIIQREELFPIEIRNLFFQIGIDIRKEIEMSESHGLDNGLHVYGGWFHFFGNFTGVDCMRPVGKDAYVCELTKISEGFFIGFTHRAVTFNERRSEIIQVEFSCEIPWRVKPNLQETAKHNLQLLLLAENNCLKKSEFENIDGTPLENIDELIDLLIKEDLIELEQDPETYFLSYYGHQFAENRTWPRELDAFKRESELFENSNVKTPLTRRERTILKLFENFAGLLILIITLFLLFIIIYSEYNRSKTIPNVGDNKTLILKGEELKPFIDSLLNRN